MDPDLEDIVNGVTDLVDGATDGDLPSSSLGGLRHERPVLYYGLLIGIVVVLAVLVYVFVW